MAATKVKIVFNSPLASTHARQLFSRPAQSTLIGTDSHRLALSFQKSKPPPPTVLRNSRQIEGHFTFKGDSQQSCSLLSTAPNLISRVFGRSGQGGNPLKAVVVKGSVQRGSVSEALKPSRSIMAQASSPDGELASKKQGASPGRFAILVTGHASPYTEEKYGGYGQLLETLLREPGEEWEKFVVVEGKFPTAEQLAKFDGFVLTGSRHDAHSDEPWILQLVDVLKEVHARKQKILGICFGHQVLCRALGGVTGRSTAGWEMGLREVKLDEKLRAKPYAAGLPPILRIYESHQDQVSAIPPMGELLGFSERTPIEIFAVGDTALGVQGHPEFNLDVLTDLIEDRRTKGILTNEEADAALESAYETTPDTKAIQELCIAFLKGKSTASVQPEKPLDEEFGREG